MFRVFIEPEAVKHVVWFLAKRYEESKNMFFFAYTAFTDEINREKSLSHESKIMLENIIKDSGALLSMRKAASKLYAAMKTDSDIKFLRTIVKTDPLFEWAIFERARRGDLSASSSIITLITKNPGYWWQAGRYIWNEDFRNLLSKSIGELNSESSENIDHILSELLIDLDQESSAKILLENWEVVKNKSLYIQAALYSCNPILVKYAHESIRCSENPIELFKHVLSIFGHRTKNRNGITRQEQIRILWRYNQYLSDMDI